ncbi:MAG: S-layer homology domain-containing protein [Candidatus Margulisiibacteriota bacterium]|nr:S-layer homology domain-containing protein [Candidatus Margulisiibacteriota bacterium]
MINMKLFFIILLLVIQAPLLAVDQAGALSIQTAMTSSKEASFSRITPTDVKSIGSVMVNPAAIGGISYAQTLISTYQLSSHFDYRHFSFVFPYKGFSFGLSYGTNLTSGFTETEMVNNVIYETGSFSSGFDLIHLAAGKKVNEPFFFIDHFYYGFGLSAMSQIIGSSRRSPAYSIDVGAIGTIFVDHFYIDRVDVGASVVGAYSTGLPSWTYDSTVGTSQEQDVERQIFAGATIFAFDYLAQFKTGIYSQGVDLRDIMFGVDYMVANGLSLRLSTSYDIYQGQEFIYNFGTGLKLPRVAGFSNSIYDMSVDYNYTMYPSPRTDEPSHTISVAFLGKSTDQRPVILAPKKSYKTTNAFADFNGVSDRNAIIYVYNNETLIGQIRASNNGQWQIEQLLLDEGYNSITFRAKSSSKDLSEASSPLIIHYDKQPPVISSDLNIVGDRVEISLTSNEELQSARLVAGERTIQFKKITDSRYATVIDLPPSLRTNSPLPDSMVSFNIVALDTLGNQAPTSSISFFVEPLFPSDQSLVYSDAITVLGYASPFVKQILINGQPIQTDKNNAFSSSVQLDYGKQLVLIDVISNNGQKLSYYARLICIKRFEDIPKFAKYRRDIEFLATLGYVDGRDDGLFHPEDEMTRREVTLAIAKQQKLEAKELQYDPFLDIPKSDPDAGLISAAVDAGVTFAFADGTFRPNEKVSVADAFKMLNNSGVIDSDEVVVSKEPIKRYEFALFFKQVRRYDQRVNFLLNWDEGYSLPD